jgi:hypothetical protein
MAQWLRVDEGRGHDFNLNPYRRFVVRLLDRSHPKRKLAKAAKQRLLVYYLPACPFPPTGTSENRQGGLTMTTWFVSRHPGALQWAQLYRIDFDHNAEHLDMARVQAGDWVIGSLPVNLAVAVCALGAGTTT